MILLWKFSWTQIRDTDSYSDTDSTKLDFDLSNQTLNEQVCRVWFYFLRNRSLENVLDAVT